MIILKYRKILQLQLPQCYRYFLYYQQIIQSVSFNSDINSKNYLQFNNYFEQTLNFRFYNDPDYQDDTLKLESALVVFCALALNCSITNIDQFTFENIYYKGIVYNFFDVLYDHLCEISNSTYLSVKDIMDNPQTNLLIFLSVSIFVSVMAMIKFIFLMFDIKTQRENILFLFLDIPIFHVDVLYKKCDRFLKNYVSIEDLEKKQEAEGFESSEEEVIEDGKVEVVKPTDDDEQDILLRQTQNRKKIIKKYRQNRLKGNQGIIVQQIHLLILLKKYVQLQQIFYNFSFYSSFYSLQYFRQLIVVILNKLFITSILLKSFYYKQLWILWFKSLIKLYINIQKLMMLNYSTLIQGQQVTEIAINNLTIFTGNAQKMSSFNFDILTQLISFRDMYITVYFGDLCEQITNQSDLSNCQSIINANLQLGIYNTESYFLDYFRNNIQKLYDNMTIYSELLSKKQLFEIDRALYNYIYDAKVKQSIQLYFQYYQL